MLLAPCVCGSVTAVPMEPDVVLVQRKDVERLTTEVMQMRDFLPQILNQELVESVLRLEAAESALEAKELDCAHITSRLEASQGEYLRAKEENLSLLGQMNNLREHSLQQAEYCTHMGSSLCTLLWGVSNREETVKSILGMDKAADFFTLASHTVSSFVESLGGDQPQDEDTEESRFVLGLAGTITNVAAVSCGRDFLISSCKELMEKWFHLLGKIALGSCSRLRVVSAIGRPHCRYTDALASRSVPLAGPTAHAGVPQPDAGEGSTDGALSLLLMSLYNVSINRNGLLWLSQCVGIISQLQRLLTDPDADVCLHALRLFQSVVLDAEILQLLWREIRECLPRVRELSHSDSLDVQRSAGELLEEVRGQQVEG